MEKDIELLSNKQQSRKIRVAFFADVLTKDYDGAIKTMYQLIDRIPENKFEYIFLCGVPPTHSFSHKVVKIPAVTILVNASYKMSLPSLAKNKLQSALSEFKPDVIHISTPSLLGFFGLNYAKENNIPVLSIYHTHYISYVPYYLKWIPFLIKPFKNLVIKISQKFYNGCSIVYVPTTVMIQELVGYGIDEKLLKQWARGLDLNIFNQERADKNYIRSITGNDNPSLLYASRIVWEKNIETLFDIYDEVIAQGIDVNFIVAGKGVAEPDARARMPRAHFLGYLSHNELGKLYASTDIFVFPSISESYGSVVAEATACGCTPVIARGGGSQALVKDGETGFLCEPNNAKDYVSKIKLLLENPDLKRQMQEEARKYTELFSWENLTDEYFNDITSLARLREKVTNKK